jgi:prepilin-type processing-associated H-X9-DG protein
VNMNDSRLAKYLSKPIRRSLFLCPSDDLRTHQLLGLPGGKNWYPYSYTVNGLICGDHQPAINVLKVHNPSMKILIADESGFTVDDGSFSCEGYYLTPDKASRNMLSNRHDKRKEDSTNPNAGRGNVIFVDGHYEFLERALSITKPYFDPDQR